MQTRAGSVRIDLTLKCSGGPHPGIVQAGRFFVVSGLMKALIFQNDSKLFDGRCVRLDATKAGNKVVRCAITLAALKHPFPSAARRSPSLGAVRRGV